jgi:hypothetical protein
MFNPSCGLFLFSSLVLRAILLTLRAQDADGALARPRKEGRCVGRVLRPRKQGYCVGLH